MISTELTYLGNKYLTPILLFKHNKQLQTVKIDTDCIIVGRSKNADISVSDDSLSRNHFMIYKDRNNNKYYVKDLKSTNGIVVNGKLIVSQMLKGNDTIKAGKIIFKFIITDDTFNTKKPSENLKFVEIPISFERKIKPVLPANFNSVSFISKSLLAGLVVFAMTFLILSKDNAAVLATVSKTQNETTHISNNFEQEVNEQANLRTEDKIKAINLYKIALEHFDSKNYELAKKTMEEAFIIIPGSKMAPVFISTCEEIINKYKTIDSNLDEISNDRQKYILISDLFQKASDAINNYSFEEAVSIYQKILEIDSFNPFAYDGILRVEELVREKEDYELKRLEDKTNSTQTLALSSTTGELSRMEKAFNNKDYTKAYELSLRILKIKNLSHLEKNSVNKVKNNVIRLMNEKFKQDIIDANYYISINADDSARTVLNNITRIFPYHLEAINILKKINSDYTGKAQALYYKALVSESYNKVKDALSEYRIIIQNTPKNDPYYKKAIEKINKLTQKEIIIDQG